MSINGSRSSPSGPKTSFRRQITFDPSLVPANNGTVINVAVPGVRPGDTVELNPTSNNLVFLCIAWTRVIANDQIAICFVNGTGAAIDPATTTLDVVVTRLPLTT